MQAVSITYLMVTVLLLPSNLLKKKVSHKRSFPCIMVAFGTVIMCVTAVKNAAALLPARFFLGVPESGVVPYSIMYFSSRYKPSERAWRIGIFHAANSLASGVGSFLAIGVDRLKGVAGPESGAGYSSSKGRCLSWWLSQYIFCYSLSPKHRRRYLTEVSTPVLPATTKANFARTTHCCQPLREGCHTTNRRHLELASVSTGHVETEHLCVLLLLHLPSHRRSLLGHLFACHLEKRKRSFCGRIDRC